MILELDCGNSRVKWRVIAGDGLLPVEQGCAESDSDLMVQLGALDRGKLAWCRIVSVRSEEETSQLLAALVELHPMTVLQAQSAVECAGVTNGYLEYQRLGLDRWLAMLGAYHLVGKACLILDLGTAATADLVSASGEHLGGYIGPGLPLMRSQLRTHTRRIRYGDLEAERAGRELSPGRSTAEAVERGCTLMLKGFAKMQSEHARTLLGDDCAVLVTGGDAALVLDVLPGARAVSDLVFIGLALACPIRRG